MQTVKFVTTNDKKVYVWCTTNQLSMFRDFLQYILDSCKKPKKFMIINTKTGLAYNAYLIATEQYQMRKRTFEERMNNEKTGKWAKFTDEQLAEVENPSK